MKSFLILGGVLLLTSPSLSDAQRTSAKNAPSQQSTGAWHVSESKSEMTDERTVVLSLRASSSLRGDFGPLWPTLIVRCRENEVEAYVNVGMVLDGGEYGGSPVRLRWDEGDPVEATWSRSSDYQAVFADDPPALLAGLMGHSKFRLEVHPYDKAGIVVTFAPRGISALVPLVSRACPKAGLDTAIARARSGG